MNKEGAIDNKGDETGNKFIPIPSPGPCSKCRNSDSTRKLPDGELICLKCITCHVCEGCSKKNYIWTRAGEEFDWFYCSNKCYDSSA